METRARIVIQKLEPAHDQAQARAQGPPQVGVCFRVWVCELSRVGVFVCVFRTVLFRPSSNSK